MAERALAPIHRLSLQQDAEVKQLAERVGPRFPKDLNPQQAVEFARVALAYGLDPFMGEMMPFQGAPYITLAGRLRIADEHPAFDGMDMQPATPAERAALGADDKQSVWKCTVYRKDRGHPTVGYGRAGGQAETNPVARQWTAELAQKRAQHRALRAAFPVSIPGLEERLSPAQLRAIHAFDNDLGVSDDERRAELADTFGVDSSKELTSGQATVYIEGRVVDASLPAQASPDNVPMTQPAIRALVAHAAKNGVSAVELAAHVRSVYHVSGLADLTVNQGREVWAQVKAIRPSHAEADPGPADLPPSDSVFSEEELAAMAALDRDDQAQAARR